MTQTEVEIVMVIDMPEILISLRSDDIVCVKFKKDTVLDIPLQLRLLDNANIITKGKLMPFIFEAEDGITVTKEARDNALSLEDQSPYGQTAVVVENIAYALIANFFLKFNKPKRPYKVFNSKDEAVKWLKLGL